MRYLLVTERVNTDPVRQVRYDAGDQRWWTFLRAAGLLPLRVPNDETTGVRLAESVPVAGLLLTGGNDLAEYGGDAPERDRTETALLAAAIRERLPVLGVCRGMQLVQHYFGVQLHRVRNHACGSQDVWLPGRIRQVNSYHKWAATETGPLFHAWADTPDGVVKAVRHTSLPIVGVMWHPERLSPFAQEDLDLFAQHFQGERCAE